ncbi:hypothetical protein ACET3Z_004078 [Daucus carota]
MSLPQDLIDLVLFRLPVKPLLRCRCVCKGWCSLTDSDDFVKKHHKRMIECSTRGVIISGFDGKFYLSDFESLDGGGDEAVAALMNGPVKSIVSGAEFFGAANGLVCLSKNQMNELFILNPSTRKARKIPSAPAYFPRSFDSSEIGLCGFGYDHVNDDYKIVKIGECHVKFRGILVIVYSLKTNSWKRIQNVPSKNTQFLGDRGLFANGALHWFTISGIMDFANIVSYDLGLEMFKEIPFPPHGTFGRSLVPVEESFGILYNYPSRVDVWLMNNSGEGNLWSKVLSLKQAGPLGPFSFVRPVAFSKCHKNVLLEVDRAKLVWYDIKRKRVKNVRIHGIPNSFESYLFIESLLQITNDKEDKLLQKPSQDNQGKKEQKKRY